MNGLPDRAGRRIEGYFTMVETRGQRAGGPHAPEGITTITRGVVIAGAVTGGRGPGHRRRGRRDDRADATCPDGRSNRQGQGGAVVGEVGGGFRQGETGSIQASELVRIGETGSVEGAVAASRLVVAVGAHLHGRVDV